MCGRKYMHLTEISAGFFLFFFSYTFYKRRGRGGGGRGDLERFRSLRIINTIPSVSFNKLD